MNESHSQTDRKAAEDLLAENYDLLLGIARQQRRRARLGDTMQTSDLLHSALTRLDISQNWNSRQHFVRATNLAIRHVIIDRAREKLTAKRGSGASHVRVEDSEDILLDYGETPEQLVAIGQAIDALEAEHPRWVQVIDARYFAGLTEAECASALDLSARTVRREWGDAKKWLADQLGVS
ncbi:MAG: ECF-type sigma factor [Pseudomonadota bacterium]